MFHEKQLLLEVDHRLDRGQQVELFRRPVSRRLEILYKDPR